MTSTEFLFYLIGVTISISCGIMSTIWLVQQTYKKLIVFFRLQQELARFVLWRRKSEGVDLEGA